MKKSNVIVSTILIVIFTFSAVVFVSCNKNNTDYIDSVIRPCDNVICLNGGTCTDGLCYCPQGFEGPKCATKWNERFAGSYIADDDCDTSSAGTYSAVIIANPDTAYKIKLSGVGQFCKGTLISADINPEKTSFSIPMQNLCGDLYLSGYGNMSGDFLNVYLVSRDSVMHTSTNCSIILDKQ